MLGLRKVLQGDKPKKLPPLLNYVLDTRVFMACLNDTLYASGSTKMYRSTTKTISYSAVSDITPDYYQMAFVSSTGVVIAFSNSGYLYRSVNGTTFVRDDAFYAAYGAISFPLHHGICNNGNTIIFAEYSTTTGNKRVFTSTDNGATWTITLTKNDPADIRHWHSVQWLPAINKFLLTSGDSNLQVRWFLSSDGLTWNEVAGIPSVDTSSQKYRNLGIIEDNGYIYWGSDTQISPAIYRMPVADLNNGILTNVTKLFDLPHACWGILKGDTVFTCITSVETGDTDLNASIFTSKDGVGWRLDLTWRLDNARTNGGFRSIRYMSTYKRFIFNIQYLVNTTPTYYSMYGDIK